MNHNQDPTVPQSLKLPFMQEFDGSQPELSIEETTQVASEFSGFIEGYFLAHLDRVQKRSLHMQLGEYSQIPLTIPESDGGEWEVFVRGTAVGRDGKVAPQSHFSQMAIALTRLDATGEDVGQFNYDLDWDGVVRRKDSLGEPDMDLVYDDEYFDQTAENEDLEENMGFNNQPIAKTELDGLIAFLNGPDVRIGSAAA
ncbi:hypothetical protein KDA23_02905 [Candidatus Saccharibacteria bacterium]|nr:hypothetical protein [Candidatus Saccharibacteria bacterium]